MNIKLAGRSFALAISTLGVGCLTGGFASSAVGALFDAPIDIPIVGVATQDQNDQDQEPSQSRPNAALRYWMAFAFMDDHLTPEEFYELQNEWQEKEITEERRAAIKRMGPGSAFRALHEASQIEFCDWQPGYEDGPNTLMPHLSECRKLFRLAGLRARVHADEGEHREAAELMTDIAIMGRKIGRDGPLVSFLVANITEEVAVATLAAEVVKPGADKQLMSDLAEAWGNLPTGWSVAGCIDVERELMPGYLLRQFGLGKTKEEMANEGPGMAEILAKISSEMHIRSVLPFYDDMAAIARLPRDKRADRQASLNAAIQSVPLAQTICPAVEHALDAEDRLKAKRAMLLAGIDVVRNGEDALKMHPDPFGDGQPFAYEETENGFTLRSAITFENNPDWKAELKFGK